MTEFENFFEWSKGALDRLEQHDSGPVFSSGHDIRNASWDRKYVYLLWLMSKGMPPP